MRLKTFIVFASVLLLTSILTATAFASGSSVSIFSGNQFVGVDVTTTETESIYEDNESEDTDAEVDISSSDVYIQAGEIQIDISSDSED